MPNGIMPPSIVESPTVPNIAHVHSETISGFPVYAGAIRAEPNGLFTGLPVYQDRADWQSEIGPFRERIDAANQLVAYLFRN